MCLLGHLTFRPKVRPTPSPLPPPPPRPMEVSAAVAYASPNPMRVPHPRTVPRRAALPHSEAPTAASPSLPPLGQKNLEDHLPPFVRRYFPPSGAPGPADTILPVAGSWRYETRKSVAAAPPAADPRSMPWGPWEQPGAVAGASLRGGQAAATAVPDASPTEGRRSTQTRHAASATATTATTASATAAGASTPGCSSRRFA